ncbi:MAG: beta-hydroxyacyl-ACP dehydratase [Verrucomicrobia bacterium]|nr:beta-hydroxyacyl-ACP dehydratase [Verrucomicrobiota bacterium]
MRDSISAARVSGPSEPAGGERVFEFRFGPDDPTFAGHFPTQPILPGVFQLEIARLAAEWALGGPLAVREVSRAKFQRPIRPGELVRVSLKLSEEAGSIRVRAGFSVDGQAVGETLLTLWRSD